MSRFGRGTLAAALATAMSVMPSLAPAQEKVMAKPSKESKASIYDEKNDVLTLAADYSETHPVVAIGILKGQKETLLTGEQIGDKLSEVLKKAYQGTPSKYFVAPGGDYTAIIFAVDGHLYGPYGLKESLSGIGLAASNYESKVRRGIFPPPQAASGATSASAVLAKPEPH